MAGGANEQGANALWATFECGRQGSKPCVTHDIDGPRPYSVEYRVTAVDCTSRIGREAPSKQASAAAPA